MNKLAILILALLAVTQHAVAEKIEFVTLWNDAVKVMIIPKAGKIIYFGKEKNIFWMKDKQFNTGSGKQIRGAAGGSRMYPAQQKIWHSIWNKEWSGEDFEKLNWRIISKNKLSLIIKSEKCPVLNIELTREFKLAANSPTLKIIDKATRYAYSPFPVQLWTVTQLPYPMSCILGKERNVDDKRGHLLIGNRRFYKCDKISETSKEVILDTKQKLVGMKIGTLGKYITSVYPQYKVVVYGSFMKDASYPDGASIEFYGDENNIEVETFSPASYLKKGESITNKTIIAVIK